MVVKHTSPVKRDHSLRLILFGILVGILGVVFWPHNSDNLAVPRNNFQDNAGTEGPGSHTSHNAHSRHVARHHHDHSRIDSLETHENNTFTRRDYSCSASNPCSNGACCGATGICGYGPTYCGKGCISQCDAKAECGKYAETPGKTCPLNTCCSEFGFVSGASVSMEIEYRLINHSAERQRTSVGVCFSWPNRVRAC